jgi:hypothetical protein
MVVIHLSASFHPQMVFLPNLGVNRRSRLCDVASYVSAQELDFLDLEQKSSSVNWKHQKVPMPILPIYGWAPAYAVGMSLNIRHLMCKAQIFGLQKFVN